MASTWIRDLKQFLGACKDLGADSPELVVCPPHSLLDLVRAQSAETALRLGGQDCSSAPPGPRTGEVAAMMLRDLGCSYVLLGHSERRFHVRETDADVRAKVDAAHAEGLMAIVCVGEDADVRQAGRADAVVEAQVLASLPDVVTPATAVIAYEPIWAIGTGLVPELADIEAMHATIRSVLTREHGAGPWRILYGGSVRAQNAGTIGAGRGVDGLLVGGASLHADEFWGISKALRSSRVVPS